ncbi:hypothetical protein ACEWPM_003045 [Roseovarius sp. S4756]|uniref:hypothetical protein n=1 Tax=Roseovarius maritimus TaxID=3342637 RepID=UPI003B678C03
MDLHAVKMIPSGPQTTLTVNRTRNGVLPTPERRDFFVKCKAQLEKFEDAEAHIQSLDGYPRGRLKIASSVAFGKSQLIPVPQKVSGCVS